MLIIVLISTRRLLLEVWCFKNLRLVQDFGLNGVRIELDVETPLLDLFTRGNHFIQLLDRMDAVLGLLEQALAHLCDSLLVFANFLRDANQHSEFRRQVDVLPLLLNFKQGLLHLLNLHIVLLPEVGCH